MFETKNKNDSKNIINDSIFTIIDNSNTFINKLDKISVLVLIGKLFAKFDIDLFIRFFQKLIFFQMLKNVKIPLWRFDQQKNCKISF